MNATTNPLPPQHFRLSAAKKSAFDAWRQVDRFLEANELWPIIGHEHPEAGAGLAQRHQGLKAIQQNLLRSFEQLLTEIDKVPASWKQHQDFLASEPRPQQVTSDRQIGKAMANLLDAGRTDQVQAMIDALDLAPNGPAWATWALEARHQTLWWVPAVDPIDPSGDALDEEWSDEEPDAFDFESEAPAVDPWATAAPAQLGGAPGEPEADTTEHSTPAGPDPRPAGPSLPAGNADPRSTGTATADASTGNGTAPLAPSADPITQTDGGSPARPGARRPDPEQQDREQVEPADAADRGSRADAALEISLPAGDPT